MESPTPNELEQVEAFAAHVRRMLMDSRHRLDAEAGPLSGLYPPSTILRLELQALGVSGHAPLGDAEYARLTRAYFAHELTNIYARTRSPGDYADPINLSWHLSDSPAFCAEAIADEETAEIHISLGTIHALHDLALRALSSENFYNPENQSSLAVARWQGGPCFIHISPWQPSIPYLDYTPVLNSAPEAQEIVQIATAEGWEPSDISRFARKMPLDKERTALADAMVKIALTWIFCHEEAHLRLGHLSPEVSDEWRATNIIAMEWQADRSAALRTIEFYMRETIQLGALHTTLATSHIWRLRFIASSIGLAIALLDRYHMVTGQTGGHPSAKLRLSQLMRCVMRASSDHIKSLNRYEPALFEKTAAELGIFVRHPAGLAFHLIEGSLWDTFIILELLDIEVPAGDRTEEYIGLTNEASANMYAQAFAWDFTGKTELIYGDILLPESVLDRAWFSALSNDLSKKWSIPLRKVEKSWIEASSICAQTARLIRKVNSAVDYLTPISRKLAMRNHLIKYI